MIACLALMALAGVMDSTIIDVDPAVRYQEWEGWGTSLAWWAHVVGNYAEPVRTQIVDQSIGGLQLNILRYNIGGGEAPGMSTMEPRARVPGFLSATGRWDWTADAGQRWVLRRGMQLGATKLEAFSNSPPYFMTTSGSVTGAVGGGDNLPPNKVANFANYLATVVQRFEMLWGVRFETLAPMNEPSASWWTYGGRQEGCHVSAGERQSALVIATDRALRGRRVRTRVSASDESYNTQAVTAWDALSPVARRAVYRVNTHSYGGDAQSRLFHRATREGKRLWMSEYGDGDPSGFTMARQIVRDLRELKPTAWITWQVIDGGFGWGCLDVDLNAGSHAAVVNPKYHAFAQFTRHIRPGAQFLAVGDAGTVAALRGDRLTLVTVSDAARSITIDLSRFAGTATTAQVVLTAPGVNAQPQTARPIAGGRFTADLPAKSIATFTVDGCRFTGPVMAGFQTLTEQAGGRLLEVPGATGTEGALLGTWTANGLPHQQWHVEGAGDGRWMLRNRETGMYAALWDNAANGYPVLQWGNNGDSTLWWLPTRQSDGTLRLDASRYPGSAVTANSAAPAIGLAPWSGSPSQRWRLAPASTLYPPPLFRTP